MEPIRVIGAGLAGCEATWQIVKRGGRVILYEMKPCVYSPAHRSPLFAEIICSNSFKSESLENAHGVLKEEMALLDSIIINTAREAKVPAGGSLAVDREVFSKKITHILEGLENVEIVRKEVTTLPRGDITILATGPLTSEPLGREIQRVTGTPLFFTMRFRLLLPANRSIFKRHLWLPGMERADKIMSIARWTRGSMFDLSKR